MDFTTSIIKFRRNQNLGSAISPIYHKIAGSLEIAEHYVSSPRFSLKNGKDAYEMPERGCLDLVMRWKEAK